VIPMNLGLWMSLNDLPEERLRSSRGYHVRPKCTVLAGGRAVPSPSPQLWM
jgi:hypothetical protein